MNQNEAIWSPGMTLDDMEKLIIIKAYSFYRGNKTMTSNSLGIAIRTLDNKLERYEADAIRLREKQALEREAELRALDRMRGINPGDEGSYDANKARTELLNGNATGVRLESSTDVSKEQSVSLQERKKVQKVLPKHSTSSGQD